MNVFIDTILVVYLHIKLTMSRTVPCTVVHTHKHTYQQKYRYHPDSNKVELGGALHDSLQYLFSCMDGCMTGTPCTN